jgi:hypothetical protein
MFCILFNFKIDRYTENKVLALWSEIFHLLVQEIYPKALILTTRLIKI